MQRVHVSEKIIWRSMKCKWRSTQCWFIHWVLGAGVQKGLENLDLTRFSGYKFRSSSAKGARRSSAPRARNGLKPALDLR
ncbi:hypothetical protein TNCV_1857211 [Trichonephila clavipes]|nr:hypothetical protein TNCV_1857211 [Trichonephila clavipes]